MNTIVPMGPDCTTPQYNVTFEGISNFKVIHPNDNQWTGPYAEENWKSVLTGEDPRTIMLPNKRMLAVFTDGYAMHGHNGGGTPRLGIAILSVNSSNNIPELSRRHQLRMKDKPHEGKKQVDILLLHINNYFYIKPVQVKKTGHPLYIMAL